MKIVRFGAVIGAVVAALLVAVMLKPKPKPPPVAERMPQYAWLRGNGKPFLAGLAIDTAKVRRLARFTPVTLDPARAGVGVEILQLARSSMGPRRTLLSFTQTGAWYACGDNWQPGDSIPYGCDTTAKNFSWARLSVVRAYNAVLMNMAGQIHRGGIVGQGGLVDWAMPGFAAVYADTCAAWAALLGVYDGMFLDQLWRSILYTDKPASRIDYRRSGCTSLAQWDSAYSAGVEAFLRRLRKRIQPGWLLGANFGGAGQTTGFIFPALVDFAMWESFPYQHQVTVADYLAADSVYARGVWLTAASWGDTSSPELKRRHRYVYGVALLGDRGVGGVTGSPEDQARGFVDWWPEPLNTGLARGKARPIRPGVRVWVREFERGTLTVDELAELVTWEPR